MSFRDSLHSSTMPPRRVHAVGLCVLWLPILAALFAVVPAVDAAPPPAGEPEEEWADYRRRVSETRTKHIQAKSHYELAKRRIEAQHAAWKKDDDWARKKQAARSSF